MRLTKVDPNNEQLRRISEELGQHYTKALCVLARQAFDFKSNPNNRPIPSLLLKCAHDTFEDPLTRDKTAPHFVADCTDLCKHLADAIVKQKFGDKQDKLYEVLASNAGKTAKKFQKKIVNAKKVVSQATKKAKETAANVVTSSAKAKKAAAIAAKKLQQAQAKLTQAQVTADTAAAAASEAVAKAGQAMVLARNIIQRWHVEFGNATAAASAATASAIVKLDCLEGCRLCVLPCSKCKGSDCHCTLQEDNSVAVLFYYLYFRMINLPLPFLLCRPCHVRCGKSALVAHANSTLLQPSA